MLKEISWNSYWTFIALTIAGYYLGLVILLRFKGAMQGNGESGAVWHRQAPAEAVSENQPSVDEGTGSDSDFLSPSPDSEEYPVYACVDEINAYLEEARKRKGDKEALLGAIRQIVARYPGIKSTAYQQSLSAVITAQCAHICLVHLSDADMEWVWQDEEQ